MFRLLRLMLFYLISFLINPHLASLVTASYNNVNSSSLPMLCHEDESSALLAFKNSFTISLQPWTIHSVDGDSLVLPHPTTGLWKKGTDCCEWEGIRCHLTSHHVVHLDLGSSGLIGSLHSNSTLFLLRHLRFLDLCLNDFSYSPISPLFGLAFPYLTELYLGYSNFSGQLPPEFFQLSQLQTLDLSFNDFSYSSISPLFGLAFPNLTYLDLRYSNFSGEVPLEFSQLSQLQALYLSSSDINLLKISNINNIVANMTRLIGLSLSRVNLDSTPFPPSLTNLSSLQLIELRGCNLRGELPFNLLNLPQLKHLDLSNNKGLHAQFPLSNWSSPLEVIDLSSVNFSSKLPSSSPALSPYKNLEILFLRGCNFQGQIPAWVWNISISNKPRSWELDLSDNNFSGNINLDYIYSKLPNNLYPTLFLNLSHNCLTGSLSLSSLNLRSIDISSNMFEGPLPIPSIDTGYFHASNNKFTGPLHPSLCNLTTLVLLDLSNNSLHGELPQCLGNLSIDLEMINLGSNTFHGTLPITFSNCGSLQYLDLSTNWLQGLVPPSLAYCENLQVLNLRDNKLKGEFPYWSGTLSYIQILDLSSNSFHGSLTFSKANNPFPMLQILDLSNNNFSGKIPTIFIKSLRAMMNNTRNVGSPKYMATDKGIELVFYSITLTFNGGETKYEKIFEGLVTFDLSNNKFEGEIPENIGELVSLHGLNLSHNHLSGSIPRSLSNLTLLNCLDLSSNKLTGQIPQELTSLTSLGVFNVSENQLVGPIPHGKQFNTFSPDSYKGNLKLCGFPLLECGGDGRPRRQPSKGKQRDDDSEDVSILSEWKVIMMGYGFGTIVGFAWGYYMLSIGRPFWLLKLVYLIELILRKLFGRH